jgi:hypothetical protein
MGDFHDMLHRNMAKAEAIYPSLRRKYQWQHVKLIFTEEENGKAGQSWQSSSTIEVNFHYADSYKVIEWVIVHELCHIITPLIYPNDHLVCSDRDLDENHSINWVIVMQNMGYDPSTHIG